MRRTTLNSFSEFSREQCPFSVDNSKIAAAAARTKFAALQANLAAAQFGYNDLKERVVAAGLTQGVYGLILVALARLCHVQCRLWQQC